MYYKNKIKIAKRVSQSIKITLSMIQRKITNADHIDTSNQLSK